MKESSFDILHVENKLSLIFHGELTLYILSKYQKKLDSLSFDDISYLEINLLDINYLDSASSIFIYNLQEKLLKQSIKIDILCDNQKIIDMLNLVKHSKTKSKEITYIQKRSKIEKIGQNTYLNFLGFLSFMSFMGELFINKLHYITNFKNIRFREIAFEINESGIKAFSIVALTSFLIGLVVAYQSAFQLKIYGANIFIVDMLGISVLRELAPIITAIVIAGRSGSAFTAQIGAMKITQELDAMRTMGFDPYRFLVVPRIIALMITLPILIFVADIMAIIGGMLVANIDLGISTSLFLERFVEVVSVKHFYIGLIKGPFFAFLIATIGIYRGMMVKDDTQSIGFNTTKSVVESIFAVIICDAIFSIAFTNLGI